MSYSERIRTGWQLLRSSLRVIRNHPKLALFPLLSTGCTLALVLFFFVPIVVLVFANAGGAAWWNLGVKTDWAAIGRKFHWATYAYGAVVYLGALFAGTFFNVAFYREIMPALAGESVSLGRGLRFATRRLRAILMWALLAGTVGLIIRVIEERLGWIGKIVLASIGAVWSVAAVFAIPVIIRREDHNPLVVLRDSALTLKRTWGESLLGFIGIPMVGAALMLGICAFGFMAMALAELMQVAWVGISMGALWLFAILLASILISMATHVYRCALYVYASEGIVPEPYTVELMNAGWRIKRS
jgi:hypothetical protein